MLIELTESLFAVSWSAGARVGVAGLVASLGGFGTEFASRRPCSRIECRAISGSTGSWLWPVIAVACALDRGAHAALDLRLDHEH